MRRYGVIYKLTNKLTGKIYIGKTMYSIEDRLKKHLSKYSGCHYIKSALLKYGVDNFNIEEILTCFCKESLSYYEKMFILKEKSLVPDGYNILLGSKKLQKIKMTYDDMGWSRVRAVNIYDTKTGKMYYFPRIVDAVKKLNLTKSIIEKGITHQRKSKGYIFSHANQSGRLLFKNFSHAQRIEVEPQKCEYNTSTRVRVPRGYQFSKDEVTLIKKLYETNSYKNVAKILNADSRKIHSVLKNENVIRSYTEGIKFRERNRRGI